MIQLKIRSSVIPMILVILIFGCKKSDTPAPVPEFKFPSKVINKIMVDLEGTKWFATAKGVVSYDGVKWTLYSDDKNLISVPVSDFVYEISSGIKKLWMGTGVGLTYLDFSTSVISVTNLNSKNSGILSDTVTALGMDDLKVKYIGTTKGLSILKDAKWDQYLGRTGDAEPLLNFKISSISTTKSGYIYATTTGGGVSRFMYTDAISGATTFKRPWAWGLPSDTVYTVLIDGDEQWYGTFRGVAYHTTEFTKSDWTTYTRTDGLLCDSVYAIVKDTKGNMWFGTHKGVSKLTGPAWESYTTKNGLADNKVNAIALDPDGSIWFGTDNGISHLTNGQWVNY